MASNEQSIDCEIRTLLELEKILYRDDTVQVFYRCLEREDKMDFVQDTCNRISQQVSSRKVRLLGQPMSAILGL